MKERIIEFAASKGLSPSAFERRVGWSPSTISSMNHGIRSDKLADAAREFPDLDLRWLLTGEPSQNGIPLKTNKPSLLTVENIQTINVGNLYELTEKLDKIVELLSK